MPFQITEVRSASSDFGNVHGIGVTFENEDGERWRFAIGIGGRVSTSPGVFDDTSTPEGIVQHLRAAADAIEQKVCE